MSKKILYASLTLLIVLQTGLLNAQNIVMDVWGNVTGDNKVLKKGDNLRDNVKLAFTPATAQVKLLTKKGIVVIKAGNTAARPGSELAELIISAIHKNSVTTLGTRSWGNSLSASEQVNIVDSLCRRLNANKDNIEFLVANYINPYCVSEFTKNIYWKEIGNLLRDKYQLGFHANTGNLLSAEQYQKIAAVAKVKTRDFLPSSFSLKKYCPIPGNQGQYGTCVGWASAYAARTISWAVKNNDTSTNDITNQAFSPTFVYEQIKNVNDYNCSGGSSIYDALLLLKEKGAPFINDLAYGCGVNVSPFFTMAASYQIKDFQRLTTVYGIAANETVFRENLTAIKTALAQKKPILASINCYQSFGGEVWNGRLDVNRGGHAICIVGYNDNFANGEGAVEIMNSWGTFWGNGGFIWVKYSDLKNILNAALALYDDSKPVPLDPPTPPEPKPEPKPVVVIDTLQKMQGSFSLILHDGSEMPLQVNEASTRGLKLATVESMTYDIQNSYTAGTMFRLQLTSSQPAYVYVISTDSKRSPLAQLFPDPATNTSALLDFSSEVSISVPDSTQYIQMDETPGEDYLCVIFSKEALNISNIGSALQNQPGKSFVKIVKESLTDRIADDSEVKFDKNKIAFTVASAKHSAVPIFVKINHR